MTDLPIAKAGVESNLVKKKPERKPVDVLAQLPQHVWQGPTTRSPHEQAPRGEGPAPTSAAQPSEPMAAPAAAAPTAETHLRPRADLSANLGRYQEDQERAARNSFVRSESQKRGAEEDRENAEPTSFWMPLDVKEGLLNLNARTFKRRVKINLRSLVLYAYDQLKVMPDERLADIMESYSPKRKRRKDAQ